MDVDTYELPELSPRFAFIDVIPLSICVVISYYITPIKSLLNIDNQFKVCLHIKRDAEIQLHECSILIRNKCTFSKGPSIKFKVFVWKFTLMLIDSMNECNSSKKMDTTKFYGIVNRLHLYSLSIIKPLIL